MPVVGKEYYSNSTQTLQSEDSESITWKLMSIIFGIAFVIAFITSIVFWAVLCENRCNPFFLVFFLFFLFCLHTNTQNDNKQTNKQTQNPKPTKKRKKDISKIMEKCSFQNENNQVVRQQPSPKMMARPGRISHDAKKMKEDNVKEEPCKDFMKEVADVPKAQLNIILQNMESDDGNQPITV